jgi:hypothetical protein
MSLKRIRKGSGSTRPASERRGNHTGSRVLKDTSAGLVEPTNMDKSLLDEEVAYYLAHLPGWHEHEGQHVLIHGQEHFGFFPTRDGALEEGFRRFGRVAFLVKEIRQDEVPRPLAWTML